MKDIYMLDTLGLTEPVLEIEIKNRMISKIKTAMLELDIAFHLLVTNTALLLITVGADTLTCMQPSHPLAIFNRHQL